MFATDTNTMTDLQEKIEDLNEQIDINSVKAKKFLKGIFMSLIFTAVIISQIWPFKRPVNSAVQIFAMSVYISTFVYTYYIHKQKVKKLKEELEQLS